MNRIICIFALVILSGCAASGYQQFYKPYVDVNTLPEPELIQEGQEPQVYGTDNFDRDIRILRAKKYVAIGYSSFNGGYEDTKNAQTQARRIGATIVLVNSQYTNTQTTTSTLFLPDTQTTYHSGSANAYSTYNINYGGYGSVNTNATYSGTSTTYGTKAVPITTHQRRYDQTAIYLVKINPKMKFGVFLQDLTPEMRTRNERNTGAFVDLVFEDTAAFYSNVLPGDIIISIDGVPVKNTKHTQELMAQVPTTAKSSKLVVLRNGEEKTIEVKF
ncbi:PDZ domain-containing protein [Marinobacter sp. 1-4A]|uniref:PDZ domain-containing protein n=1 Tax=Marinobacter sp. 1-4A TaxID=2582919 RepID=UPI001902F858|nr:PDZ domain-containing protein [Marinobacter sp. 1-4A]MBK1852540.1 PDZ domain-containing protein [Marinobacter sp. 1-4A]